MAREGHVTVCHATSTRKASERPHREPLPRRRFRRGCTRARSPARSSSPTSSTPRGRLRRVPPRHRVEHARLEPAAGAHGRLHGMPRLEKAPSECATCHRRSPRNGLREPPSNWKRMHGLVARAHSEATSDKCVSATRVDCSACTSRRPRHHNAFGESAATGSRRWSTARTARRATSGLLRTLPRGRQARNHVGNWGAAGDNHCLVCTSAGAQEGCVACTRTRRATSSPRPKPPDHYPGMDCRACHGLSQALPHVETATTATRATCEEANL